MVTEAERRQGRAVLILLGIVAFVAALVVGGVVWLLMGIF